MGCFYWQRNYSTNSCRSDQLYDLEGNKLSSCPERRFLFLSFKDEAFSLWMERWGKLYDPSSHSYSIIDQISNTYYLVNLVDNDYPQNSCLWAVLDAMFEYEKNQCNMNS